MTAPAIVTRPLALALVGSVIMIASPATATPTQVVADLSNSHVDITSSYHGTELLMFGAYEGMPGDDIVLVVQGPPTDIIQRRKAKRAGIWINVETTVWQQAPAFYHVFATDELPAIASSEAFDKADVGPLSGGLTYIASTGGANNGHGASGGAAFGSAVDGSRDQQDGLRRNMEANGLWQVLPSSITTQKNMLFRTSLSLPSNIPPGAYSVRVLHFRDGVALSERTTDMEVRKAGLSALIYRFAHEFSALYGIFAIIFAVASGWLASVVFRRK